MGRSGENIGKTEIQVWEKAVAAPVGRIAAGKEEGRWLLLIALSCILVFENILVNFDPSLASTVCDADFRRFRC